MSIDYKYTKKLENSKFSQKMFQDHIETIRVRTDEVVGIGSDDQLSGAKFTRNFVVEKLSRSIIIETSHANIYSI